MVIVFSIMLVWYFSRRSWYLGFSWLEISQDLEHCLVAGKIERTKRFVCSSLLSFTFVRLTCVVGYYLFQNVI